VSGSKAGPWSQVKFAAPCSDYVGSQIVAKQFDLVRGHFVCGSDRRWPPLAATLSEPDKEAAGLAVDWLGPNALDLGRGRGGHQLTVTDWFGADFAPSVRLAGGEAVLAYSGPFRALGPRLC